MTNPDYRAMCAELADALAEWRLGGGPPEDTADADLIVRARALLAQPVAEGPSDEEIISQADKFLIYSDAHMGDPARWEGCDDDLVAFTRHALDRWGRPTPQPVAVSERLPGPEDCDEQGRCWLGGRQMGRGTPTWLLGYPAWAERFPDVHRFWLPANALPLPTPDATND